MTNADDVATLVRWLEIESPSHEASAVNGMADEIVRFVQDDQVRVERLPGRNGLGDMVVLRAGPANGAKAALTIGHLDTVHALGVRDAALQIRQEGERLYGPGVYDMKGGLLIGLQAFLDAARGGRAQRPLIFAMSPDEEIGSPTSRAVIEDLARQSAFALVLEPARQGGGCVTARKAVGRFRIAVEGRAAHAGMKHEDGRSAIREAAHQVLAIEAMTDYAQGVTASVGLISGGSGLNVVPQFSVIEVDFRAPTEELACGCVRRISGLQPVGPDTKLTIEGGINRPAMERTPESAALYERARALAAQAGIDLAEAPMTGGGSDGNVTAALGVPTLDGLGIEGAGAHTLQEYGVPGSIAPRRAMVRGLLES